MNCTHIIVSLLKARKVTVVWIECHDEAVQARARARAKAWGMTRTRVRIITQQ